MAGSPFDGLFCSLVDWLSWRDKLLLFLQLTQDTDFDEARVEASGR